MMDYYDTELSFLFDDLKKEYGEEFGTDIYIVACKEYETLYKSEKNIKNDALYEQMAKRILPVIALYRTLIKTGFDKSTALDILDREGQKRARQIMNKKSVLKRLPFFFSMYRLRIRHMASYRFPNSGWKRRWGKINNREINVETTKCLNYDMCQKYNCPELCIVFCNINKTIFSAYMPKVALDRPETLVDGDDKCIYHLYNPKKVGCTSIPKVDCKSDV